MNTSYIKAISYYVPDTAITNADLIKDFPDWSEQKIVVKIGIKKRYVANDMTAGDLAESAAKKLFSEHNIDKNSIDTLILCTQSPDYFLPTTACILQDKLGLPTTLAAFDFNQGCSGFVYGLSIAKGMISAGISKNILLLTSETYNRYIHKNDRGNRTLFSDAAAATLVSTDGFLEIGNPVLGTDGSGYKNLIVESGAHRMKRQGIEIDSEQTRSPDYLYMDGPAIFNFTLESVPILIEQTLIKNNLRQEDIDLFVFHQANKHILKFIREAIAIPEDKFYLCMEDFGNTVSSTIPIALYHAQKEGRINNAKNLIIAGFGVGYSWGAINLINSYDIQLH